MGENTQASVYVLNEMDNFLKAMEGTSKDADGKPLVIHDQQQTELCHSFATMLAFENAIKDFLRRLHAEFMAQPENTKSITSPYMEYLEKINDRESDSFRPMITIFLGCVSPRSFSTASGHQTARTEKVIARLVYRTAFECAGWKRILPVARMFTELGLQMDDYELTYETVNHPNSHYVKTVLEDILGKGKSWFETSPGTFKVSIIRCGRGLGRMKIVTATRARLKICHLKYVRRRFQSTIFERSSRFQKFSLIRFENVPIPVLLISLEVYD